MRIVVTGATGFLGRAFIRHAVGGGHLIAALVRPTSTTYPEAHPDITVLTGTLATPPWDELARFAPDVCLHAAWITEQGLYWQSPENDRYVDESLGFVRGLLQRGVSHIVALGTCAEYGPSPHPLIESKFPLEPGSPYAQAKHHLHNLLHELVHAAGARLAWARIFQPYGPGESSARLCTTVARRIAIGSPVNLEMPSAVRDWIYVDDVATALLMLVERCVDMAVNVGSGVGHTVDTVARTIAKLMDRVEHTTPSSVTPDIAQSFVADHTRLRALGWTPRVGLEAGLSQLIAGLR